MTITPVNEVTTSILVVGGGLSGSFAAIRARQLGAEVMIVDKGYAGRTCISKFASSHLRFYEPEDDIEDAIKEIVEGGDYMNDQRWLEAAIRESFDRVKDMDRFGVKFEKENGRIRRVPSKGRISASAVFNSPQMMMTMRKTVEKLGATILDHVFINDLLIQGGVIVGATGIHRRNGEFYLIHCQAVILAAGPCSLRNIYYGHQFSTGDAYGMAYEVGAQFGSMECGSHNTSSKEYNTTGMGHWVGSGGKFVNASGEAFMARYNPLKDRANMTWVARAMATEVKEGRGPIYFDFTAIKPESIELAQKTMPWATHVLKRAGIDVTKDIVEWVPAFKGSSSCAAGIKVDIGGQTNVSGLFATGDAGSMVVVGMGSGFGGFNLTYCVVFGYRTGEAAALSIKGGRKTWDGKIAVIPEIKRRSYAPLEIKNGISADDVLYKIQQVIFPYEVSILKSEENLTKALDKVTEIRSALIPQMAAPDVHELIKVHETRNMALYAEMFLRAALFRNESRGLHYREDYPAKNAQWVKWTVLEKVGEEMRVSGEPLPAEAFKYFTHR